MVVVENSFCFKIHYRLLLCNCTTTAGNCSFVFAVHHQCIFPEKSEMKVTNMHITNDSFGFPRRKTNVISKYVLYFILQRKFDS